MNVFNFFIFYNYFLINIKKFTDALLLNFLYKIYFLFNYFLLNELIWQEGLLCDFLQKKIIDNWIKKFLIYSAYLFNERLVFEKITRFYLDLIIWPLHKLFIFEFNNVSNLLLIHIIFFLFFFIFFYFFYFFLLLF